MYFDYICKPFSFKNIDTELYDKTCVTAITTKYNATDEQAQKLNRIITTAHNYDSVCFAIIFNIDIHTSKQSKRKLTDITKAND